MHYLAGFFNFDFSRKNLLLYRNMFALLLQLTALSSIGSDGVEGGQGDADPIYGDLLRLQIQPCCESTGRADVRVLSVLFAGDHDNSDVLGVSSGLGDVSVYYGTGELYVR